MPYREQINCYGFFKSILKKHTRVLVRDLLIYTLPIDLVLWDEKVRAYTYKHQDTLYYNYPGLLTGYHAWYLY